MMNVITRHFTTYLTIGAGYYLYTEASSPRKSGEYTDLLSPPLAMATATSAVEVRATILQYNPCDLVAKII